MIALAEGLSAYLVSNSSNRYLAHGQFGIFAGGAQLHARKRLPNYDGEDEVPLQRGLLPRARPRARAHGEQRAADDHLRGRLQRGALRLAPPRGGLDLAGHQLRPGRHAVDAQRGCAFPPRFRPARPPAESFLRSRYPDRFLGVVYGDSSKTIPRYKAAHAAFTCDAAFIDGDKSYHGRRNQLRRMRGVSYAGGRLFFDEVTAERCLDGSVPLGNHTAACQGLNGQYWPAVQALAYDKSVRDGEVRVLGCAYPERYKDRDGICTAEFAK